MQTNQLINALIDRYGYRSYLELNDDDLGISMIDKTAVGGNSKFTLPHEAFINSCRRKFDIIFTSKRADLVLLQKLLNTYGCLILTGDALKDSCIPALVVESEQRMALVFHEAYDDLHYVSVDIQDLLSFLPTRVDCLNWMTSRAIWGRIGHQFNDIVSGIIISELFGLRYYYSGFCGDNNYHGHINDYINLGDFIGEQINDTNPTLLFYTCNDSRKWAGLSLVFLRRHLRHVPPNTNIIFTNSTFFGLRQLALAEHNHDVFPGSYCHMLMRLRRAITHTRLYKEFRSDFDRRPCNGLTVAVYVRAGGRLQDNSGRGMSRIEYEVILDRVKADFGGANLNVIYYTQGPLKELIGDFSDCDIRICDEEYPRLYEVIKTFLTADVFVCGQSSFSTMISAFRTKPTYCSARYPFILPDVDIVVPSRTQC